MKLSTAEFNRRSISQILQQQIRMSDLQSKISSGQRVEKPSDDPIAALQILALNREISQIEQFEKTSNAVKSKLGLEENVLSSMEDIFQRLKELAVQAGNASYSQVDRAALGLEMDQRLEEFISLVNTRDTNGQYIFSGYQGNVAAVSEDSAGQYHFGGDEGQRFSRIGTSTQVAVSDSGSLFFDPPATEGSFRIVTSSTNSGTATVDMGRVSDSDAWTAALDDSYVITFNALNPGANYDISLASNPGVPLAGFDDVAFTSGDTITVNGVTMIVNGTPSPGDSFTLEPAATQDMFTSIARFAYALQNLGDSSAEKALVEYEVGIALANFDFAEQRILSTRASVGTRTNVVDSQLALNDKQLIRTQETLSRVGDLDYASAISDLTQTTVALQAAQQSYSMIQGLTLFNYI